MKVSTISSLHGGIGDERYIAAGHRHGRDGDYQDQHYFADHEDRLIDDIVERLDPVGEMEKGSHGISSGS
jgi:hypothetical protein